MRLEGAVLDCFCGGEGKKTLLGRVECAKRRSDTRDALGVLGAGLSRVKRCRRMFAFARIIRLQWFLGHVLERVGHPSG